MNLNIDKSYSTTVSTSTAVALTVVIVLALLLFNAWVLMLIVGGLHALVSDSIPAIGYGASILVTLALGFVASFFRSPRR